MNEEIEEVVEEVLDDDILEQHQNDLMDMFDEASFFEKWRRVREGLRMPVDSGPHKWAKLQMMRLMSPIAAVVVPIILLAMITIFSKFDQNSNRSVEVTVVDPEPMEELEDIEEPVIDEIEPPDPVEVDVVTPDVNVQQTDVAAPPQDTTVQQAKFDSVAIGKSPMIMKGIYGSRSPGSRGAALSRFGGNGSDIVVLRALRYLKKNQHSDGSWGKDRVAMTSLALLAYLAHGETPGSAEFGGTVKSAIEYIISKQKGNGFFIGADNHQYTQPIAAYALAETFAVTKIPRVKDAAVKALIPVVKGQNPSGGFNYNLKPSERDDTSYMGWCVQALKSGKMAGLYGDVPGLKESMHKAIAGFRNNYSERESYGKFGYAGKGGNGGLTGVGVLCLQFLGAPNSRECKGGLRSLANWKFDWDNTKWHSFVYYMYYTTQALFQQGGQHWKNWNAQFLPTITRKQNVINKEQSGYTDHLGHKHAIGSWKSPSPQEHTGGNPVMETILCTLMLEVYYRYLPTFMVVPEEDVKEEIGDQDDLQLDFGYIAPDMRHKKAIKKTRDLKRDDLDSDDLDLDICIAATP
jgi:hypothetical protein